MKLSDEFNYRGEMEKFSIGEIWQNTNTKTFFLVVTMEDDEEIVFLDLKNNIIFHDCGQKVIKISNGDNVILNFDFE